MNNNFLVEGSDYVLIKKEINKIINKLHFNDVDINKHDIDEVQLDDILEDLDTYGFLSSRKIIIVNNFDHLKQDENEKGLQHLYKYLDNYNPDYLLFIIANKFNNTLKITKELKKRMQFVELKFNSKSFIKSELSDYDISDDAIDKLIYNYKDDFTAISNECMKLRNYCYDTKKITLNDVNDLLISKYDEQTETTFAFNRALAERNKKEALIKFKELLNYNIEPLGIIGLIASQIRIIYQVKILDKQRISNSEIASILQEKSEYRIKKTKELIYYYSEKELLNLMIKLADMDFKIKTSDIDAKGLIEDFIINI